MEEPKIITVGIYEVEPDKEQPRHSFDAEKLEELSRSIAEYGLLQPLLVQRADGYYKIIAGERRYRAARLAGLKEIPVIVKEYEQLDTKAVALIENLQRQDLNPMEECTAYQKLMDEFDMTQDQLAAKLGRSRSSIANSLRLRNLPEAVQTNIREGNLSLGHAKVLLSVEDPVEQSRLALRVISENLSVRDLEDLIKNGPKKPKAKPKAKKKSLNCRLAEEKIGERLATKVTVTGSSRKGRIEIEYYNDDDLERIVALIAEHA